MVCLGDVGLTLDEQKLRFRDLEAHIATLSPEARAHALRGRQGDRGDGGALIYLIETPEGSLLYQDTSGHWSGLMRDLRPDVAILAAAGRGNIDGDPIQGTLAEFVARQAAFLQPKRVLLSHHDNWLPGFSLETNTAPIRDALAERAPESRVDRDRLHGGLSPLRVTGPERPWHSGRRATPGPTARPLGGLCATTS